MKTIIFERWNYSPGSPSIPVGPFLPYAYHQHYSRGPRYYEPDSVPAISYGAPTQCDMLGDKARVCRTIEEALALLGQTSRSHLGKHGARGILRVVPDDYPSTDDWWKPQFKFKSPAEWAAKSPNSPYNKG